MEGKTGTDPLFSEGGINYVYLNESHKDAAIEMLTEVFVEAEPFGMMCGIKKEGFKGLHSIPWKYQCENGISVAAIDEATGKLCGVFTAEDKYPKMGCCEDMSLTNKYISLVMEHQEFETMFTLVDELNVPMVEEHAAIKKKYKTGKQGVMCHMVCVAVHKDFGRRGIGGHLTRLCMENCKKQGYYIAYAECSSLYSTRALVKFGGVTEKTIDYKTYMTPGGCCSKPTAPLVDKVQEPHTCCNLVVFRLKDEIKKSA